MTERNDQNTAPTGHRRQPPRRTPILTRRRGTPNIVLQPRPPPRDRNCTPTTKPRSTRSTRSSPILKNALLKPDKDKRNPGRI